MADKKSKQSLADMKRLSDEQINAEVKDLRHKLFTLRSQTVTEKVEDISQFRKIRHEVARLLTEQTSRWLVKNPRPVEAAAPAAGPKSIKMKAKRPGGAKAHRPKKSAGKPVAKAAK